jgi:hypothetical protein
MRFTRERDERDKHWQTWLLKRSRQLVFAVAMLIFLIFALLFHEESPETYEVGAMDCPQAFNVA